MMQRLKSKAELLKGAVHAVLLLANVHTNIAKNTCEIACSTRQIHHTAGSLCKATKAVCKLQKTSMLTG